MGLYKLRKWVGTVTGKGARWGRDRLGRSAPAFLAASTTALPPSTCTARREAGRHPLAAVVFAARPANCWLFLEACAGRKIRRLCPPAVVCSAGCVPACLCHAHCTHQFLPPIHFALLAPLSFHVRQDHQFIIIQQFASCETVPLAVATRASRGGPCAGPFDSLTYPFSCRVQ